VDGLTRAFRKYTEKTQFCALGSVKANIGHLDTAAGAASLLKSILVLNHKFLPPLLHFKKPNGQIDFASSPFYINTEPVKLKNNPLICGISSFGLSGTNCHLVLEEFQNRGAGKTSPAPLMPRIFTLSGKTYEVLLKQVHNYLNFLKQHQHLSLSDICYTVNCGRGHYDYRLAIITKDIKELEKDLLLFSSYTDKQTINQKNSHIFYHYFQIVPGNKKQRKNHDISEHDAERKTGQAKEKMG
jgi:iturin family lipopeptide synthetase A